MLSRQGRRGRPGEEGFTLIELLLVAIMIGILCAIALPAFLGQKAKANDATTKSAISAGSFAAMTWYADHDRFDGLTVSALRGLEPSLKDGAASGLTVELASGDAYKVRLADPDTGHWFALARSAGLDKRTCGPAGNGGCPSNGEW